MIIIKKMMYILQWASVASWFFRPENSILTTMANSDSLSNCSSEVTSIISTKSNDSNRTTTTTTTSATTTITSTTNSTTKQRNFQPPTISAVSNIFVFFLTIKALQLMTCDT